MEGKLKKADDELQSQKKEARALGRQAKAKFETNMKTRMQEAGIKEQAKAVSKDRRGNALRQVEATRREGNNSDHQNSHALWGNSKEGPKR